MSRPLRIQYEVRSKGVRLTPLLMFMENEMELGEDSVQILVAEYEQKYEVFRKALTMLVQLIVVYLAITAVSVQYALQNNSNSRYVILLAVFDVIAGGLGAIPMFVGRQTIARIDSRMGEITTRLGIQHEGMCVFNVAVWVTFTLYLCVCAGWIFILYLK